MLIISIVSLCILLSGCSEVAPPSSSAVEAEKDEVMELPEVWEPVLISEEAVSRYISGSAAVDILDASDNATDSSEVWTDGDYNDSGWSRGIGSLGAKDGVLGELSGGFIPGTLLEQYPTYSQDSHPVYLFRYDVDLEYTSQMGGLIAEVVYDDAVIIYLNGSVVYEGNVPDGGYPTNDSYGAHTPLSAPITDSFLIPSHTLSAGPYVLCVELHQADATSSDVYFDLVSLTPQSAELNDINVSIGEDETTANFVFTGTGLETKNAYVELKPVASVNSEPINVPVSKAVNTGNGTVYRATAKDLEPNTQYSYSVYCNGLTNSGVLKTGGVDDGVQILAIGDPQLTDDNNKTTYTDILVEAVYSYTDNTDFAVILGDVADEANDLESYKEFYAEWRATGLPTATVFGNHDDDSGNLSDFINMPNMSLDGANYTDGEMGGNYYYKYGDALIIALNSNLQDVDDYSLFLNQATSEHNSLYGEPAWTIVTMHHSLFSQGPHSTDEDITLMREEMTPLFQTHDVDLVLSAHDHLYTRSYLMQGTSVVSYTGSEVTKSPGETLYLTLSSSTGSKYYDLVEEVYDYSAFYSQPYQPMITEIEIIDNSLSMTTIRTDNGDVMDSFTLYN